MTVTVLSVLCALLLLTTLVLAVAIVRLWRQGESSRSSELAWHREAIEAVERDRDHASECLRTFMSAARTILWAMADEVERATGHTDESYALECLARDVERARNPLDVVSRDTACLFADYAACKRPGPLSVADALELAAEHDQRSRKPERRLYRITRLCQLHTTGEEARWLANSLALMQRLFRGDAVEARRQLREVIDLWERTPERDLDWRLRERWIETRRAALAATH